ncbi:glycosyltransferase family 39 protein [Pseudonocardia yuanmonensis]|uniref:Glycosyltransferase family 39 protein n=1 Tax=Pseudonocardia yuanmonensis TaxID=1095914 RepID=A0ABP8XAF9_9PSEU
MSAAGGDGGAEVVRGPDPLSAEVPTEPLGRIRARRGAISRAVPRAVPWARVGRALLPAALFLGVRAVGIVVLAMVATRQDTRLGEELGSWDGQWFLGLAQGGYDGVPAGLTDAYGHRSGETPLAFFPGYPATVAVVRFLTGLPLLPAALTATTLAGIVAAYGVARLGELVPGGSRRAGLVLVVLFASTPLAVVFSMAYSEALFCAAAAWSLVFLLRRQWVAAGLAAAAAGLVRPTAAALVAAVGLAALAAVVARREGARPWCAIPLAAAGLLGYLGYVATRTGSLTGWFVLQQRGWDSRFDGGRATAEFAADALADARSVMEVATVGILLGAIALLAVSVAQAVHGRLPWPLVAYSAVVLLMDVGSNGLMGSKARLLVPAFTLLLPVAVGLYRRRPGTRVAVLVAAVLVSAWFGAYALADWPYAI